MAGYRQLRRAINRSTSAENHSKGRRDWVDHLTLGVGLGGFLMLVVATVLTQMAQTASSRDSAEALDRFSKLVTASREQAQSLREQVRAANTAASAAKIQAQAVGDQAEILRASADSARQAAEASASLAASSHEALQAERVDRRRALEIEAPYLVATDAMVRAMKVGSDGKRTMSFSINLVNRGRTPMILQRLKLGGSYNALSVDAAGETGFVVGAWRSLGITPLLYVLAPGEEWRPTPTDVSIDEGVLSLSVNMEGTVYYTDIFGELRELCYEFSTVLNTTEVGPSEASGRVARLVCKK